MAEIVDLDELQRDIRRNAMIDLQVSLPGRIGSYERDSGTASVTWGVQFRRGTSESVDEPPARAIPVVTPRGDGYGVHFDVAENDVVVGLAADRAGSFWRDGTVTAPRFGTLHSLGNAVSFPGGRLASESPFHQVGEMLVGAEDGRATVTFRRPRGQLSGLVVVTANGGLAPELRLGGADATLAVGLDQDPVAPTADLVTFFNALSAATGVPVPPTLATTIGRLLASSTVTKAK